MRGKLHACGPDSAIAALAEVQHGVVARRQLIALGLGAKAIDRRLRLGRLHRIHRGVYAVGHRRLTRRGRWIAAVLAAGPDAVLSHRSAAALWDLLPARGGADDVTSARQIAQPGIRAHRHHLRADEVTVLDAIPVTTVARTLLDLAATTDRRRLARAAERAEALRLTDMTSLDALVQRYPRRQGTRVLRAMIESGIHPTLTRSELEDRFLTFVDAHGLPRPEVNVLIEGHEVDFLWRRARVIAELDGHETHGTRAAFERDRARDRALQAGGWRVVRITWRQLHETPAAIAADLRRLL